MSFITRHKNTIIEGIIVTIFSTIMSTIILLIPRLIMEQKIIKLLEEGKFRIFFLKIITHPISIVTIVLCIFIIYYLIISKITKKRLTSKKPEEIIQDKSTFRLKNELRKSVQNLQPLFDITINFSFYYIIEKAGMNKKKERFRILNYWFSCFNSKFEDSNDFEKICEELVFIINQTHYYFNEAIRETELPSKLKEQYNQLKSGYNTIVGNLNYFFTGNSDKLDFKIKQRLGLLPDLFT